MLCMSSEILFICCTGLLIEQLTKGTYECMICCNVVKRETAVWNCSNCYHIYHLYCIKRWANSSKLNDDNGGVNGWRCPACQNVTAAYPNTYVCFCGMFFSAETLCVSSFYTFTAILTCIMSLSVNTVKSKFICIVS